MQPRSAYSSNEEYMQALRDWFAGQALVAHASTSEWEMLDDLAQKNLAEASYEMADAMIAARSKGEA